MKITFRCFFPVLLAALCALTARAADKVSQGDGLWNSIIWSPAGTPVAADIVHIEGGFAVDYSTGSSPSFSRIYVGDSFGALPGGGNGTLDVSGGTLTVNSNAAGAFIVGRAANSIGTINVTGGVLRGTGASGTGMQIGFAANSQGFVNVSSGSLALTGGLQLGLADGSAGHLTVSGGTVTVGTGSGTGLLYVGARLAGATTTGTFEQTGGTVTIDAAEVMGVGFASASTQNIIGTARITGGNFSGNVRVGRDSAVTSGGGSGTLTIGPAANIAGGTQAWNVGGNGKIVFELGSAPLFNTVDLSLASVSNALIFSQAGAQIAVDGTNLAFAAGHGPVTFFSFAAGKGPDAASQANVMFDYIGFAGGYAPALMWKDTGLLLYLYGLPTYGHWIGGTGTWSNLAASTDWRDASDTESGAWGGEVATFAGTAGTVTVDNSNGPVVFTGVNFNTTGYVIAGDSLTTATAATAMATGTGVTATVSAPIAGTGGIVKNGPGTLVFSGANTYGGATSVSGGTLNIEGNQSAATGAVTVATGGTLAGAGTTGGAVTVENGGTLRGQNGQVFTMADLHLGASANLDVTLDAPGTNRLFQVNGNLTLDGVLNVTAGPGFGPGVYRLIDYTGSLTNQGLSLGVAPVSLADLNVQTSVANQVNLVFSANTKNFWSGGNGMWTADAGGTAWTNFDASTQGAWQPQFAIFQAAPGVVTVDNTAGAVSFTGAQFAVGGYTIAGDALTTNTAATVLRVGDGSAAGAAMTAVISAPLTGSGGIEKTDLGTLILAGSSNYTGGTTVSAGTLQLGNGGTTGSIAGPVINDATFAVDRSDVVVFSEVISGSGALHQRGSGALVLTANNSFSGGTTISAGTLQLGNGGATGSIAGDVVNNGSLAVNRSDAHVLAGSISGTGSFLQAGSGTTIMTGANTYTGGTTVGAGTLQLGNGGATGGFSGGVVNDGVLTINRNNAFTLGGLISGTGELRQTGTGTTTLAGANTYTGATAVNAGTLLINGTQSAATGAISVAAGATLGGSGQSGGAVTVQNGGTLRGQSGQTFTLGSLALGASANLDANLGAPSATALFQVNGDLVLDGTLNVTNAGAFGQGLYRLINYTGSLNDNGLTFGSLPSGVTAASLVLQTSTANQVNLFYNDTTTPLPVWDGGSGVWSVDPAASNWGDAGGSQSGAWRPAFAILAGSPGTITIDDSAGPLVVTGIQFASDGYLVTGGQLTNNTPAAVFRVGDGTTAGSAMAGTIASSITGTGGINKTDLGTLVLSGNNTFQGGVTVTAGVLQVGADANLGVAAGTVRLAGGTLRAGAGFASGRAVALSGSGNTLDTQANNLTLSGVISGTGSLTKRGSGRLILAGNNTFTGATVIAQGGIVLEGGSLATTTVSAGAGLFGNGRVRGNLTNSGTVSPGASPGTLTVSGNFTQAAAGSYAVEISPVAFDRLVVDGTATLGGTLAVSGIDGYTPSPGQSFQIIEAGARVTGQFATVTSSFSLPAMLQLGVLYGSNDVTLEVNQRSFALLPGTGRQITLGRAVDAALAAGSIPALRNVLNGFMTEAEVLAAVDELSPGIYGRWFEQAVYTSGATTRSAESRLAGVGEAGRGLWMELVRRETRFEPARGNPEAEGRTDGLIVGGDLPVGDQLRVGALFGYAAEDLTLDARESGTKTDRFQGALYGRYTRPEMFVEAVLGAGTASSESWRHVMIPGYTRVARGSIDSHETFASVRVARPATWAGFDFVPYLGARYVNWTAGAFDETGADDANLAIHKQTGDSLAARAGLAMSRSFSVRSLTLTPRLDLALQQELREKLPGMVAAEIGGGSLAIAGRRPKGHGIHAAFGMDLDWKSRLSAYVRFAGEWQTSADEGLETRMGVDFSF